LTKPSKVDIIGNIFYTTATKTNVMKIRKKMPVPFQKIKLLALDFDGVLTDGYVYTNQRGEELVRCSRKDSLGIAMLQKIGTTVCVLSKEKNPIVRMRCKKMGIPCYQGIETGEEKQKLLKQIAQKKKIKREEVAFMGDDVNDISALLFTGIALTVADGHRKVKRIAHYVTKARGGEHAVREVCEKIIATKHNTDLI